MNLKSPLRDAAIAMMRKDKSTKIFHIQIKFSGLLKLDQMYNTNVHKCADIKGAETAQNGSFHLCNTIIALDGEQAIFGGK
jgi:hypothetical protein